MPLDFSKGDKLYRRYVKLLILLNTIGIYIIFGTYQINSCVVFPCNFPNFLSLLCKVNSQCRRTLFLFLCFVAGYIRNNLFLRSVKNQTAYFGFNSDIKLVFGRKNVINARWRNITACGKAFSQSRCTLILKIKLPWN